jgi:hypothetical protein
VYNLFEQKHTNEILNRVEKLQATTKGQWGKMKVDQMLAHVAITLETPFKANTKQHLLGKIFGKMAKKSSLSNEPFKKNSPTDKSFIVKDERQFESEKSKVIAGIKRFTEAGPTGIPNNKHPFFGDFTSADWSFLMHKHLDHHLKQFGV